MGGQAYRRTSDFTYSLTDRVFRLSLVDSSVQRQRKYDADFSLTY